MIITLSSGKVYIPDEDIKFIKEDKDYQYLSINSVIKTKSGTTFNAHDKFEDLIKQLNNKT